MHLMEVKLAEIHKKAPLFCKKLTQKGRLVGKRVEDLFPQMDYGGNDSIHSVGVPGIEPGSQDPQP